MEYAIGSVASMMFLALLFGAFCTGYKMGSKPKPVVEVDEQVKRRAEQLEKELNQILSYDLATAMQRKKVT